MLATAQHGLFGVGLALAAAAAGYALLACAATGAKRRAPHSFPALRSPVSVLKPLCGAEPRLYGALRSFCELAGADIQLVCGVQDEADAAIPVVRRLQHEFPEADIQLVIDPSRHGGSAKVSNLINMMKRVRHPHLIVTDSDIRAPTGYLEAVLAPLADPAVGIVTCAYRAAPGWGIWSQLAAVFVDEWFMPGVRVAALFGSRSFAFGALIALRRDTLDRIGGFTSIAGQLADDYRLGELTRRAGLRTVLADITVETFIEEKTASALIAHELRWLRTIRTVQPLGYAFSFVTFSIPVAALGVVCSGGAGAAVTLFAATALARLCLRALALRARAASADRSSGQGSAAAAGPAADAPAAAARAAATASARLRGLWRSAAVVLAGDTLMFALWCWSFVSRRVRWRQQCYEIAPDGSMTPVR
jgi:ceramide glucosyltransferase